MKNCVICHRQFSPSKYNPRQSICMRKECQNKQKQIYATNWRKDNLDYFKNRQNNREASRIWRLRNPDYYKKYRKKHPELKMKNREYVRKYRKKSRQPPMAYVSKDIF